MVHGAWRMVRPPSSALHCTARTAGRSQCVVRLRLRLRLRADERAPPPVPVPRAPSGSGRQSGPRARGPARGARAGRGWGRGRGDGQPLCARGAVVGAAVRAGAERHERLETAAYALKALCERGAAAERQSSGGEGGDGTGGWWMVDGDQIEGGVRAGAGGGRDLPGALGRLGGVSMLLGEEMPLLAACCLEGGPSSISTGQIRPRGLLSPESARTCSVLKQPRLPVRAALWPQY
ncbi:hypothetical protein CALCODRAFT_94664 [Calocera cornea HHB12733]|uniref:Uncharacterized protein n=1 Tax=Calocera cornea HHB12733 TaxID=1353952 RepID=A0A165IHV6_9BASI|nr:hypothetical protein CALCODRAFT_94664 [Calocera cornea HHB12733]